MAKEARQVRQVRMPQMLRNPFVALQLAEDLLDYVARIEKEHADAGTQPPTLKFRQLRAISRQLKEGAERYEDGDE